jgi:hypothetical protein
MSHYQPPQPPVPVNPYASPPPSGRPKWTRKRVLLPAGFLIFFIGVVAGTDTPETEKAVRAKSAPAPTATVTATATATAPAPTATATITASAEPAPTVTVTRTKTVRVTVTPAEAGYGSDTGSGSDSSGGGGGSAYYANCTAVRAAGAAPIRAGDPGYGRHLDRDGDGVACE